MALLITAPGILLLLVFLYPLLIIAFTHNTLSAEQEQGTWNLICSQPTAPLKVLGIKAGIRFVAIVGVWLLTLLSAALWLRLPPLLVDRRLIFTALVSLSYLLFWFAASLLAMSFRRSSNFNALALLGVWLCLTILVPVALNVALSTLLPVPEAMEVTVRQRVRTFFATVQRPPSIGGNCRIIGIPTRSAAFRSPSQASPCCSSAR